MSRIVMPSSTDQLQRKSEEAERLKKEISALKKKYRAVKVDVEALKKREKEGSLRKPKVYCETVDDYKYFSFIFCSCRSSGSLLLSVFLFLRSKVEVNMLSKYSSVDSRRA